MGAGVKLAAALGCAASLGLASQGEAAVVVQTKFFRHVQQVVATDVGAMNRIVSLNASESKDTAVRFEPFDTGLGTLTGVRLELSSTQAFDFGVSVVGFGVAALDQASFTSAVSLGGSAIGGLSSGFSSTQFAGYCDTEEAGFCLVQRGHDTTFDFDVSGLGLNPFLAAGGVALEPGSTISLTGSRSFLGAHALLTEVGVLDWNGTLSLTYSYDAKAGPRAPVPEPAGWALMTAGFAFIGAAVRRRRVLGSSA